MSIIRENKGVFAVIGTSFIALFAIIVILLFKTGFWSFPELSLPFRWIFVVEFLGIAFAALVVAIYGSNKKWGRMGSNLGVIGGINKWIWFFIGGFAIFIFTWFIYSPGIYDILVDPNNLPSTYEIGILGAIFGVAMGFILLYVMKPRGEAYWRGF